MEFKSASIISQPRFAAFASEVAKLEAAVKSGVVPNTLFKDAKDTFNRMVEKSAEAFLATGPHNVGHHQSDWWLKAYDCDAFVSYTNSIPTALKRATKSGMKEYAAFLEELLPLNALLQDAKPLIKKRGDLPKAKTAAEIEREAEAMTCQCCGGKYLARTGTIAHHGYERPGTGWQTASCSGAKALPFEKDHATLDWMIDSMERRITSLKALKRDVTKDVAPISIEINDLSKPRRPGFIQEKTVITFTRKTFEQVISRDENTKRAWVQKGSPTFDIVKQNCLNELSAQIRATVHWKKDREEFRTTWKHTHNFDKTTKTWVAI